MPLTTMRPKAQGGYSADGAVSNWAAVDANFTYLDLLRRVAIPLNAVVGKNSVQTNTVRSPWTGTITGIDYISSDEIASTLGVVTCGVVTPVGTLVASADIEGAAGTRNLPLEGISKAITAGGLITVQVTSDNGDCLGGTSGYVVIYVTRD